jgi:uncharacterized cupin superfamily protein
MTRQNERNLDSDQFTRRKATADTLRKITGWKIWTCAEPRFQNDYDITTTMVVQQGAAILTFGNGEIVDLQAGDVLTIEQGASASWVISEPIRNSYQYHNSFDSASQRAHQLRW